MRTRFLILIIAALSSLCCFSQSAAKADELFQQQQYAQACIAYQSLLGSHPHNQLYQYRYARCLQQTGKTAEAIRWFELAGERYALRNFHLAQLYAETYRFEDAQNTLEKYIATIDEDNDRYPQCMQLLEYIKKGCRYIRRVEDIVILDSIVVLKQHFLAAYHLGSDCGTLSADSCGIVFTNARGDSRLQVLTKTDGDSTLFHIASCERLLSDWSACDTLPEPVNSSFNTAYPFMLTDGMTLYFASDNEEGLGGYDIYLTRFNPATNSWLTPENLGFPFNSAGNDYMMAIDEQQAKGFFATDRRTTADSVVVYSFVYDSQKHYLRDTTGQYIRQAAQLLSYSSPATGNLSPVTTNLSPVTADPSPVTTNQFTIIINDSTVFHSFSDFHSPQAQQLARDYILLLKTIQEETEALRDNRENYRLAETDEQQLALRPIILTQEKTIRNLSAESSQLLKQLRAAENSVTANP